MICNQYRPVFAAGLPLSKNPLLSRFEPGDRLAAPIGIRARIERILYHAVHRVVPNRLPDNLTRVFWPASNRQLHLLLVQPEIDLPYAAQLRKLAKDETDCGLDPGIRIFLDAVVWSLN